MNKKYDVIIPVASKDVSFVPQVVLYIRKNLVGVDNIYIITANSNISRLNKKLYNSVRCLVIDEDKLIDNLSYSRLKKLLYNVKIAPGWYFQQFIKLAFGLSSYAHEYYLSWDSDTLPLSNICFFQDDKPLFTIKKEYHKPYFETSKRLIGIGKTYPNSFIAEHMMFNSGIVRELINTIECSDVEGVDWIDKIINACDFSQSINCFSEFETYGTWCMKRHNGLYGLRQLNTFRSAGMIRGRYPTDRIIERLAFDIDIASFEMQDARFPYNINWLLFRIKRKLYKSIDRWLKPLWSIIGRLHSRWKSNKCDKNLTSGGKK